MALAVTLGITPSAANGQTTAPQTDMAQSSAQTFDPAHSTPEQDRDEAWGMLTTAFGDSKHAELRIQALAALGTLGANERSEKMIREGMDDADVDVRTAAVLAAGQTRDRNLTNALRDKLDDKEPQVSFAAAITLSRMGDRSGEDVLAAVVNGDRKAKSGVVSSSMHTMNKDFHDPASLAKIGALQGASMLLGPFGFGITAYEYMRKNGGDSARVTAIEELAKVKTNPIREELVEALTDKDPAVRAAAAKALGEYHDQEVQKALLNLFTDPKDPVRLTAAAAYLRSNTEPSPGRRQPRR